MPASRLLPALLLFVLAAGVAAAPGAAGGTRIDLLGEESVRDATLLSLDGNRLRYRRPGGAEATADLDDLVALSFPPPPGVEEVPGPADVEVILRGGDRVRGELVPGEPDEVKLRSELLGEISWLVDAVREIRFLGAWATAAEKPSFAGEGSPVDLFYYRSLDHVEGTFMRAGDDVLEIRRDSGRPQTLPFEDLLVVRFAEGPGRAPPDGRLAVVLLSDGSRVTATSVSSDGNALRLTTVNGREISVPLRRVLSVLMKGGRFVYLSDLEPARTTVTPWLGEAYAWDRPRFDRSVLDDDLRAGGETFRKGIGAISGTEIAFAVPPGYASFAGKVALDDAAGDEGDVVFEVLVDGESRWRSETIRRSEPGAPPARIPPVSLAGARELTLRVEWVDDFVMDFANWLEPMLIRAE